MLILVAALRAEATPLIDHFGLQREPEQRAFEVWSSDDVTLVISGIGKAAAAVATGYLGARGQAAIWLNVGIAGHGLLAVGQVLLAHKVVDRAADRSYFPMLPFEPPCETAEVVTVDQPELRYPQPVAYEMEASGFVAAAQRFQTAELVHCLKVVSDGPENDIKSLDRQRIRGLISSALPVVEAVRERCLPLLAELNDASADPPDFEHLLEDWHFSFTDRQLLRRLLNRRRTLVPGSSLPPFDQARRGRDVNRILSEWLDRQPRIG